MTEDDFWKTIAAAKSGADDANDRPAALQYLLETMTPDEVQGFQEHYLDQVAKAYSWELWGAAFVMLGGCSDDGFDYFRDWLISEGRDVYERALGEPDSLADLPHSDEAELEGLRYVAHEVYEAKAGGPMTLRTREFQADPSGSEWDEDSVTSLYPRLAAMYW